MPQDSVVVSVMHKVTFSQHLPIEYIQWSQLMKAKHLDYGRLIRAVKLKA